jgi:hypothetical protein
LVASCHCPKNTLFKLKRFLIILHCPSLLKDVMNSTNTLIK